MIYSGSTAFHKSMEQYSDVINLMGIEIKKSALFPFEIMYDACDVKTHEQISIPSGEWIHGVMMPQTSFEDIKPVPLSFAPEFNAWNKTFLDLRIEMFNGLGIKTR
jgi:hypothetical protein